jgi:hypothetical protein
LAAPPLRLRPSNESSGQLPEASGTMRAVRPSLRGESQLFQTSQVIPFGPSFDDEPALNAVDRKVLGVDGLTGRWVCPQDAGLGSAEAHANRNLVTFAENIDNLFVGGQGVMYSARKKLIKSSRLCTPISPAAILCLAKLSATRVSIACQSWLFTASTNA